jgi:hypothetical protein
MLVINWIVAPFKLSVSTSTDGNNWKEIIPMRWVLFIKNFYLHFFKYPNLLFFRDTYDLGLNKIKL